MKISRRYRFIALGLGALLWSGCGFHFAGQHLQIQELPDLNIQSELPNIWQQRLYRYLQVHEVTNYPSSKYTLHIENFEESKRPVSLNSRAKVAEYSIEFTLQIRLTGPDNKMLLEPKILTAQRIYRFNEQQVPGKQAEEDFLKNAIIEDLFDQMLRYVDIALQQRPVEKETL